MKRRWLLRELHRRWLWLWIFGGEGFGSRDDLDAVRFAGFGFSLRFFVSERRGIAGECGMARSVSADRQMRCYSGNEGGENRDI